MSIPEIDTFKQKYPMYSDMDDLTLATKLGQKFPKAYGDLAGKVAMQSNKSNPDMQGGANAPALVKARNDVTKARSATDSLDPEIVGANYANARLLGIPGITAKMLNGSSIPEATSAAGKILSGIATVGGGGQTALKPALKLLGIPIKAASDMKKFSDPENRIDLAQEARKAVYKTNGDLMDTFGGEEERILGQSDTKTNIQEPISNFKEDAGDLMQNKDFVKSLKLGNPNATKILNLVKQFGETDKSGKPIFPQKLPAKDVMGISRLLKDLPGIKTQLTKPPIFRNFTNNQRVLLNLSNDLKGAAIEEHPEMQALNEHYAQTKADIRSARSVLRTNQTIGNFRKYSGWDDELKKSFNRVVPKETVDKIKDLERAGNTYNFLKLMGKRAVEGGAVAAGGAAGLKGLSL